MQKEAMIFLFFRLSVDDLLPVSTWMNARVDLRCYFSDAVLIIIENRNFQQRNTSIRSAKHHLQNFE